MSASCCRRLHRFGGASTPVAANTGGESRSPRIVIAARPASSSFNSAALKEIDAAATFSSRWATFVVPGIGTIQGFRADNQASASWAGVAFLRRAQVCTSLHQRHVGRQRIGREARDGGAEIILAEARPGADGAGEEAHAQRAPADEADAQFLAQRKHLRFRTAPQHRILVLDRRHRVHGMRAADRLQPGFGQAVMTHLALGDQSFMVPATSSMGTFGSTRCW